MRIIRILSIFFITLLATPYLKAQTEDLPPANKFQKEFNAVYKQFPQIPRGMLEAVAFTQTRFAPVGNTESPSCIGIPRAYGIMGLVADGKGYFKSSLDTVSRYSGIPVGQIQQSTATELKAYAKAIVTIASHYNVSFPCKPEDLKPVLMKLSEIPFTSKLNDYAMNSHLYQLYWFLEQNEFAGAYGFTPYHIDFIGLFGKNDLSILSAPYVSITSNGIYNKSGKGYQGGLKSPDYAPAIWDPAPSCNYSTRNSAVSAVTIHTVQGTYAGAISWAKNCNSNVSYHYVVRSSDGQITQMVRESIKAWHVGSENPYTIGYEHEGYISNPSWYTTALYNASAALSLDVTKSGYGINPLRTYYGPSSSGTNVLGACTRIKGHQHYPNQTHTDPGQYWDWERYYKLINKNPSITTLSVSSGTFYDSGGAAGNYSNDERKLTLISPSGASSVTISFSQFDLEANWDFMFIYDGKTTSSPLIGKYTGTTSPGTITASSGSVLVEFRSDCGTTKPGWACSWNASFKSVPGFDSIAPTSALVNVPQWATKDFGVQFSDSDNIGGSGLYQQFYQVIYFNGTEWRANATHGFFSDNFDSLIHPDWTISTGTWKINNKVLEQSDQALSNTNIYASVNQDSSDAYLYHWSCKIDGSGTNKRGGFHFMCDSAQLSNRGNSYFFWLREDDNKLQIYEVNNNTFTLVTDDPFNVNKGQWYDVKVTYSKLSGKITVYVDNSFASSWTDPSPLKSGNAVSFRSGNSIYTVNNLKVYHKRGNAVTVKVGPTIASDARYQNIDPTTPTCRVKSIVTDTAGNISNIAFKDVNVDWTPPAVIDTIKDGLQQSDIDTTYGNTQLSANWSLSQDSNSAVAKYWYAIGDTPGDTNIVGWTDNWFRDTVTHTGLSLSYGKTYYFSVKAENGAGLVSTYTTSDGQYVDYFLGIGEYEKVKVSLYPNPAMDFCTIITGRPATGYKLLDDQGRVLFVGTNIWQKKNIQIDLQQFSSGTYHVLLEFDGYVQSLKLIKQ